MVGCDQVPRAGHGHEPIRLDRAVGGNRRIAAPIAELKLAIEPDRLLDGFEAGERLRFADQPVGSTTTRSRARTAVGRCGSGTAISMAQGARLQDRLIADHGSRVLVAGVDTWSFPTPEQLLAVSELPGAVPEKLVRLHSVARAALEGLLDPARLRALGDVAGPASLLGIRGIGPFWSSGIYLRGCGIPDVLPDEPLAIAALGQLHGLGDRPDPAAVARLTNGYAPLSDVGVFPAPGGGGAGDHPRPGRARDGDPTRQPDHSAAPSEIGPQPRALTVQPSTNPAAPRLESARDRRPA